MKKVLLLTDVNFWEDSSGHRVRIKALIKYLSQHVQLTIVNTGPASKNIPAVLNESYNAEFIILENRRIMSSAGYGRRLRKTLGEREFDSVIIEYIHSTYFLNYLNGDPQIILDAHDIISDRAEEFRRFNYAGALYELPKETEFEILDVYDRVMVLCEPDRQKLASVLDHEKILLCPHPVIPKSHNIAEQVNNVSFIASAYLPNQDAINYFIKNCWPAINERFSQVQLRIYGTVCDAVMNNGHSNISLNGFVPDLEQIYKLSDIMINPVRFGAGLKIKNVEALAHGVPLVTTPHGARGLEQVENKAFLVAGNHSEFAESVVALIEDRALRQKLSNQAFDFVAENLSVERCFNPLIKTLTER